MTTSTRIRSSRAIAVLMPQEEQLEHVFIAQPAGVGGRGAARRHPARGTELRGRFGAAHRGHVRRLRGAVPSSPIRSTAWDCVTASTSGCRHSLRRRPDLFEEGEVAEVNWHHRPGGNTPRAPRSRACRCPMCSGEIVIAGGVEEMLRGRGIPRPELKAGTVTLKRNVRRHHADGRRTMTVSDRDARPLDCRGPVRGRSRGGEHAAWRSGSSTVWACSSPGCPSPPGRSSPDACGHRVHGRRAARRWPRASRPRRVATLVNGAAGHALEFDDIAAFSGHYANPMTAATLAVGRKARRVGAGCDPGLVGGLRGDLPNGETRHGPAARKTAVAGWFNQGFQPVWVWPRPRRSSWDST